MTVSNTTSNRTKIKEKQFSGSIFKSLLSGRHLDNLLTRQGIVLEEQIEIPIIRAYVANWLSMR